MRLGRLYFDFGQWGQAIGEFEKSFSSKTFETIEDQRIARPLLGAQKELREGRRASAKDRPFEPLARPEERRRLRRHGRGQELGEVLRRQLSRATSRVLDQLFDRLLFLIEHLEGLQDLPEVLLRLVETPDRRRAKQRIGPAAETVTAPSVFTVVPFLSQLSWNSTPFFAPTFSGF